MDERRKGLTIRWVSAITVIALYAVLYLCTNFHYDLNDDVILLRSFAGCVGDVPERFNAFTHTLLAWPLHGLSVLFPTVAWFSVLQLALLAAAAYAILSAIQRVMFAGGWPLWLGWLAAVAFLLCFVMTFLTSITFTTTAAVLGAAAVWQLLAVDLRKKPAKAIAGLAGSFVWLLLAYMLRDVSALPNLCFWIGALLCRGLLTPGDRAAKRAQARTLAVALGVCLLTLGALAAIRAVDVRLSGQTAYLRWIDASVAGIDYGGIRNADAAALQKVGWTENERSLILNWYFLDDNITAEAFESFVPYANVPTPDVAMQAVTRLLSKSRSIWYFGILLGFFCLASLFFAALRKPRRFWPFMAPIGTAAVAGAALGYLALQSRLPMRAAAAVLVPACALMLGLLMTNAAGMERRGLLRRGALVLLALAFGFLSFKCVRSAWSDVYNPVSARGEETSRYEALEDYALSRPGELFIAENALGMDWRLFPDWRGGKATNVLYNWGGWNNYSEGYRALFRQYGLEAERFTIGDFRGGAVRLVAAGSQPSDLFMAYLREKLGPEVQPVTEYAGDGFTVFSFR